MNHIQKTKLLNKQLDIVAEAFLREMIRKEYPEWIDYNGKCDKCDDYYNSLLDAVVVR